MLQQCCNIHSSHVTSPRSLKRDGESNLNHWQSLTSPPCIHLSTQTWTPVASLNSLLRLATSLILTAHIFGLLYFHPTFFEIRPPSLLVLLVLNYCPLGHSHWQMTMIVASGNRIKQVHFTNPHPEQVLSVFLSSLFSDLQL